ncbi:MAG: hypothetical protein LBI27_02700 [Clostridiales bacterium]|jgi:hypothetical protein|nr:hypothetical protein [Clostridiales bacterium]
MEKLKISEWKLAQKIQASGRRGMIIGICIGVLLIAVIILAVVKIVWMKKNCCCECDGFDDDYYIDDEDDESFANEKDFV